MKYSLILVVCALLASCYGEVRESHSEAVENKRITELERKVDSLIGSGRTQNVFPVKLSDDFIARDFQKSGRCQALTKKGKQCKRIPKSGSYCWQHSK